jgi:hypothetical protein
VIGAWDVYWRRQIIEADRQPEMEREDRCPPSQPGC